jgi:hypothetical protein
LTKRETLFLARLCLWLAAGVLGLMFVVEWLK